MLEKLHPRLLISHRFKPEALDTSFKSWKYQLLSKGSVTVEKQTNQLLIDLKFLADPDIL